MKIRSAILRSSGVSQPYKDSKPIHIEEIELDSPQVGEVLIQILEELDRAEFIQIIHPV